MKDKIKIIYKKRKKIIIPINNDLRGGVSELSLFFLIVVNYYYYIK
jgi:hypothetical protein